MATCLFASHLLFAGTPVIDGVFDGTGVWGNEVGSGDGNAGWAGANARKLYITYDDNYVYMGAACNAQTWQSFVFVVNAKPGGSSMDSWARQITYMHTNKPDFLFRGNLNEQQWSEYHS